MCLVCARQTLECRGKGGKGKVGLAVSRGGKFCSIELNHSLLVQKDQELVGGEGGGNGWS